MCGDEGLRVCDVAAGASRVAHWHWCDQATTAGRACFTMRSTLIMTEQFVNPRLLLRFDELILEGEGP